MNQKKSLIAHVCLVPMSPKEFPSNALKQYTDYVRKSVNKARNSHWTSESPFLGEHYHADTAVTSVTSNDYTNGLGMPAKNILTNDGIVSDTASQTSPMDFPFLSEVNHCDMEADHSKSLVTVRRNSVVSSSSCELAHTSHGKKVVASLHLTPIKCDRSGCNGTPLHLDCSETMSDLMDDSLSSGSDRANAGNFSYFLRSNLKQKDISYEEMSVTSIVSRQSDSEQHSGESIFPSSVVSSNNNAMSSCEHLSLDLSSYSPPSSPVSDGNESIICNNFPHKINAQNEKKLSGKSQKPRDSKPRLLSPEVKPLHDELVSPNKKMRSLSDGTVFRRESSNPCGNLLVKVEDIRKKLKPCRGGGFTLPARGRLTNSGRRVANDYSEKSLVNASITSAILATPKVKKRKARRKVQHSSTRKGKKARPQLRNSGGLKNKAMVKYENLKFSELNTVSRMSVRYSIAFQKWGFVFSGALDLINQRLANQNAFWDSLGSSG